MANRACLCGLEHPDDLGCDLTSEEPSRVVYLDEGVNSLRLPWLALFRSDDLREYSDTYVPLRELTGKHLEALGPVPEAVTKKRTAPVARGKKPSASWRRRGKWSPPPIPTIRICRHGST